MQKNNINITVFTPTYNRANLLKRVFNSLLSQTDLNFIWLIVDDGSQDDTRNVVDIFKKNSKFEIIYYYKKNGGKHTAHNFAVKKCKTDYFLILDSDDCLDEKSIEILNNKIKKINNNPSISGIIGNRFDINSHKVIGTYLPDKDYLSGLELYQKYKFKGDTLRLYKTYILKKYLFPEINGEKFIDENVVFDKIDLKYKLLLIKEKIYYTEYQMDGYTKNIAKIRINNPYGYSLSLKSTAETALTLKKKFGYTILYILWNKKFGIKKSYKNFSNKICYCICLPISYIFKILKKPKFYYKMFEEK